MILNENYFSSVRKNQIEYWKTRLKYIFNEKRILLDNNRYDKYKVR